MRLAEPTRQHRQNHGWWRLSTISKSDPLHRQAEHKVDVNNEIADYLMQNHEDVYHQLINFHVPQVDLTRLIC